MPAEAHVQHPRSTCAIQVDGDGAQVWVDSCQRGTAAQEGREPAEGQCVVRIPARTFT